jgi:hypothetical protein
MMSGIKINCYYLTTVYIASIYTAYDIMTRSLSKENQHLGTQTFVGE